MYRPGLSEVCASCEEPASDIGVVVAGRTVPFCGLACAIGFLEDLFGRWSQSLKKVRLN